MKIEDYHKKIDAMSDTVGVAKIARLHAYVNRVFIARELSGASETGTIQLVKISKLSVKNISKLTRTLRTN